MREETDSNSFGEATDSHPTKKDAARRRAIRKERVQTSEQRGGECKLTKEERAKIQKEKNREAAQRSRDLHKEYVSSLENELKVLRQQLEASRRLCHRCQLPLADDEDFFTASPLPLTEPHPYSHCDLNKQEAPFELDPQQGSFMRLENLEEESSFLKMVLFVCAVAIAIFAISFLPLSAPQSHPRTLVEVYQTPTSPLPQESTTPYKEEAGLVEMTRGLDNEMCLDSLMRVEAPIIRKGLRTIHPSSYQSRQGILVCSYKTPKVYTLRAELNNSPLVKIFLLGSEIKEMLTSSGALRRLLENIQLNGIYQLSAEIKGADLVPHHNCLL